MPANKWYAKIKANPRRYAIYKEILKENWKRWYAELKADPQRYATSQKKWKKRNTKRWQKIKADPQKHAEYLKKKREQRNYKEIYKKNRKKILKYNKGWRDNLRKEIINAYGNKCECCGETRYEFLCIDHKNGNGEQHRRRLRKDAGVDFYCWLRKQGFPKEEFRLLCHNCNMSLGLYSYCPHNKT